MFTYSFKINVMSIHYVLGIRGAIVTDTPPPSWTLKSVFYWANRESVSKQNLKNCKLWSVLLKKQNYLQVYGPQIVEVAFQSICFPPQGLYSVLHGILFSNLRDGAEHPQIIHCHENKDGSEIVEYLCRPTTQQGFSVPRSEFSTGLSRMYFFSVSLRYLTEATPQELWKTGSIPIMYLVGSQEFSLR